MPSDSTSYCAHCKSYPSRTESDEVEELKGLVETKDAELKGHERTIADLQEDKALYQTTYEERVAKHAEERSRLERKIRHLEQTLYETKYANVKESRKRLQAEETTKWMQEHSRVTGLERRNRELEQAMEKMKNKADADRKKKIALETRNREPDNPMETQAVQQRAEQLACELQKLKQNHSSTTQLLHARTKELTLAQQFLTTADSISGADVIRLVEKLNGEILQCAADLADKLPPHVQNDVATEADVSDQRTMAAAKIRELTGEPVVRLLRAAPSMEDPSMAVQIAVQACLVSCCHDFVSFWHCSHNAQIESAFQELYTLLRRTGMFPNPDSFCGMKTDTLLLSSCNPHRSQMAGVDEIKFGQTTRQYGFEK